MNKRRQILKTGPLYPLYICITFPIFNAFDILGLGDSEGMPPSRANQFREIVKHWAFICKPANPKSSLQPPPPLHFTLRPQFPALITRVRYQTTKDSLCAAGPIFPEPAESRIKTLGGSPAPSASWQTPVFPHVVLHGFYVASGF